MRWRSHAAFSCHWSRPRDIWCIKPSLFFLLFFWTNKSWCQKKIMFFKFLSLRLLFFQLLIIFWFLCFNCSSHFFMAENHLFLLSSPCFIFMFPVLLFSLLMFCQGDLMARDTRHQEKWVWRQWWKWSPPRYDKEVLCWFFFCLSMTGSLSWWAWINQRECRGWWF